MFLKGEVWLNIKYLEFFVSQIQDSNMITTLYYTSYEAQQKFLLCQNITSTHFDDVTAQHFLALDYDLFLKTSSD